MVVFVADDLGLLGPGIPDLVTELCPPKTLLRSLEKGSRKRRDASPQSTCRAERNPGPEKHHIRNVQIRNVAVLELFLKFCTFMSDAQRLWGGLSAKRNLQIGVLGYNWTTDAV